MNNRKLATSELGRLTPEKFKESEKIPVWIVLDNIRSAGNVGSIFRTCDAFRCAGIYICGITCKPPHREISKTAIGATETVEWKYFSEVGEAISLLKEKGCSIISVEQTTSSTPLEKLEIAGENAYAFILGNEVNGVSDEAIKLSDDCVEIPQYGTKHSLNVSVCSAIVIWEMFKKFDIELFN